MKLSYLPDEAHRVLCWSFVSRISTHRVLVHQTFITLNCFALLPLGAFRVLSCLLDSEDSNAPSDQILIFCLCSAALESKQHNECDMCLNRKRAEHFRFRMSPVICEFLWLDQTAFLRRSIDGVLVVPSIRCVCLKLRRKHRFSVNQSSARVEELVWWNSCHWLMVASAHTWMHTAHYWGH